MNICVSLPKLIVAEEGEKHLNLSQEERIGLFKDKGIEHLLGQQKASLERFRVSFDVWTSEKDIRDSGKPDRNY